MKTELDEETRKQLVNGLCWLASNENKDDETRASAMEILDELLFLDHMREVDKKVKK